MAALVGVGGNVHNPMVTKEIAQWAIDLVTNDVQVIIGKFQNGEVGEGDHIREAQVVKAVAAYEKLTPEQRADYGTPSSLCDRGVIVPYLYLRHKLLGQSAFADAKSDANLALQRILQDMCKAGILTESPKEVTKLSHGWNMLVYMKGMNLIV